MRQTTPQGERRGWEVKIEIADQVRNENPKLNGGLRHS